VDEQVAFAGSARIAELLRSREISSREFTELYLARIERLDPELNAFIYVQAEKALAQADEADRRLGAGEEGPLLGVPISVKDVEDIEGEPTRLGTDAYDGVAESDSPMVSRLRLAGAVFLGKTALPELAICGFTESKTYGVTRNPWDTGRTPSGSSGGAGAAVAAGLCAAGSASDGAGSIRNPAAFCNLFGLKPQRGRIPLSGTVDHWRGLSVTGCITQTVMDTAVWLDATMSAGGEPGAPPPPDQPYAESAASAPGKLRIATSTKPVWLGAPPRVTDDVKRAVADAGELLRSLGHEVREKDPSYGLAGNNVATRYLTGINDDVEAVPHPERLESRTRGFGRLGSLHPRKLGEAAERNAEKDAARINRIFDDVDVLITPVVGEVAFPVRRWEGKGALRTLLGMTRSYCFAGVWNHTGQPAAAVPMGFTDEGLPRSVQVIVPPNREDLAISLAAQIEAERPWTDRRPAIS
jgi:amidase